MKKLLLIALNILFVTSFFVSCTSSDSNSQSESKSITRYTTEGKETKLVPDETATGELAISIMDVDFGKYSKSPLVLAVERFSQLYPNVDVKLDRRDYTSSEEYIEYSLKLQTEVMSGGGPDVFWLGSGTDILKVAKSGRVADLTEYIENDKNFNVSDYNEKVFYSGQLNGKQYLIPTSYRVPVFLTTQTLIDEGYIDIKKFDSYESTMNEFCDLLQRNKSNYGLIEPILGNSPLILNSIYMDIFTADYENNIINMNVNKAKKALEKQKEIASYQISRGEESGGFSKAKKILNKKSILSLSAGSVFYDFMNECRYISTTDRPVISPLYNINDGISSLVIDVPLVNDACKNKQNAYNFIKVLISPEIQGYMDGMGLDFSRHMTIPISNAGRDAVISKMKQSEDLEGNKLTRLSQELIDKYISILNDVDNVVYETEANKIFMNEIQPYLNGDMDIDTCLESIQGKLDIYISE